MDMKLTTLDYLALNKMAEKLFENNIFEKELMQDILFEISNEQSLTPIYI